MTISDVLFKAYKDIPLLDKELILISILCCDRVYLHINGDFLLQKRQIQKFRLLYFLRKKDYPLAYILNKKQFYNYSFFTPPGVFIPRPETENFSVCCFI